MTKVLVDLRRAQQDGTDVAVKGYLECSPTARRNLPSYVVLPKNFIATLVDGKATLELAPTADGLWAWKIVERTNLGAHRVVVVPDSPTPLNYGDLQVVDPKTLDPAEPLVPAWQNYLDTHIEGEATARTSADETVASDAAAALAAGLATKVNTSTYTAGLAAKADTTALTTEATTRDNADQVIATTLSNYATSNDAALAAETAARVKGDAAPLVAKRTLGDITLANTGTGFADLDDSGTPNARNLDIVFPNVTAGQTVELEANLLASNATGVGFLTFASIVAGAPVNMIHGTSTSGVSAWFLPASAFGKAAGAFPYTLQAGDIENGNARFRLRYKSAGSKTIYANGATTYALTVVGRGPKG